MYMPPPYKISQLDPEKHITYEESVRICKSPDIAHEQWHMGQMKLFYSELLFLTKYAQPNDRVVYVGAASGDHTNMIAELFPQLKFDLYDKNRFRIQEKWIKTGQIQLFKEYFTDTHAENYALSNERILFICDMRNLEIGKYKGDDAVAEADIIVTQDMIDQMRWCQIIKPAKAYLKFRLPYETEETRYLTGTIYLQVYAPISTETRLCTSDYETTRVYDNKKFDEMLAYHNAFNRCKKVKYPEYDEITSKFGIINNWDNCCALMIIGHYLKRFRGKCTADSMGKLFMKVYNFHQRVLRQDHSIILVKK